jgi:hypothetical protein
MMLILLVTPLNISVQRMRRRRNVKLKKKKTVQSKDHELIPARDASLAAMQGSASGSNVCYYQT